MTASVSSNGDANDAADVLVFSVNADRVSLVGGRGRGLGCSGVVEVELESEPLAARVRSRGAPVHVSGRDAIRIVGPYWASQAVVMPAGAQHLVVFGGMERQLDTSAVLAARRIAGRRHPASGPRNVQLQAPADDGQA
jgi:hypothetical protein